MDLSFEGGVGCRIRNNVKHERLPKPHTDHNAFTLGNIAGHDVIAGLPQTNNYSAAAVVT